MEEKIMKRAFSVVLVLTMLLSCFALFSCTPKNANEPKEQSTRMTIDINPSVEFMLDEENKVVSVTALNDDGAILIAGEVFVGLSAEEAGALVVEIAKETGYLIDSAKSDGNEVKFSISGDSSYAQSLKASVKASIENKLDELNIQGIAQELDELMLDELKSLVVESTEYTEEEVDKMSKDALYSALAVARIDSALLLTDELRDAYYQAKEYEISFAERKETARIIDEMGTIYAALNTLYKTSLDAYQAVLAEIEEYRYNALVSPDSQYQIALRALREKKVLVIEKRNELADMDELSAEYIEEKNKLDLLEAQYTTALGTLESLGDSINGFLETLLIELRAVEETLVEIEEGFSDNIKAELESKASELEAKVNQAKDSFFEKFEAEHAEDIERVENELIARKQALIEANSSTAE
jgi:hypothetical protein